MNCLPRNRAAQQVVLSCLFALVLVLLLRMLGRLSWHGTSEFHTFLETIANGLALTAGVIALARFYTKKSAFFLLLGAGLIATAALDGYHGVITSSLMAGRTRSAQWILTPWSGATSRMFLSLLLCASLLARRLDERHAIVTKQREVLAYLFTATWAIASFIAFMCLNLPPPFLPHFIFHRPVELIPTLLFVAALIGYLRKRTWTDPLKSWLVLSLIASVATQIAMMSYGSLYDPIFIAAHLLKIISYVLLLAGLFMSMYSIFKREEEHAIHLGQVNESLAEQIRQRQNAVEALQQSEAQFRTLAEGIPQLAWMANADGWIFWHNQRWYQYTGTTAQQAEGWGWKSVHDPAELPKVLERWKASIATGEPFDMVCALRGADGVFRPFLTRMMPLRDSQGEVVRWFGTNTDVSAQKQAEEAMIRSEKLASVGHMAASIAHEINNPLGAVTNLLFLARATNELPDSARRYLEIADEELRRIAHISRQALGFYRESTAPERTSVNAVLQSAIDVLSSKIRAKQAVVEKQWDGDVEITAVAGELRQVFSNLLANSLDAIGEKGIVKLRVSTGVSLNGNQYVRVTVADNGKGISASLRRQLFEPFVTTKGTTGTGLGLWVSKQLIDKHNGTIRVRSNTDGPDHGTVFSVTLPGGACGSSAQPISRALRRSATCGVGK